VAAFGGNRQCLKPHISMDENKENAPAEQGAPPAAQPAAEQSAPTKSAAETKLEGQLADAKTKGEGYKKERDVARKEHTKAVGERDAAVQERNELRTENTNLKQQLAEANKPKEQPADEQAAAATATQEPSKEDVIKDILKRNGLKKCWMLAGQPCFSEAHAKEYAGADFDSLTVISVEEDAGTN
jgi:regulator of replication initiation timing